MIGHWEGIDAYQVWGWAYDPAKPDEHLVVEIWLGQQKVGTCSANVDRHDLRAHSIGKGDHGFQCALDLDTKLTPAIAKGLVLHIGCADDAVLLLHYAPLEAGGLTSDWQNTDLKTTPLFILGSHRSGTSALTAALLATKHFEGQSEGELLDLIAPLMSAVDAFFDDKEEWFSFTNTMFRLASRTYFVDGIRNMFIDLVPRLFSGVHWLDKTPGAAMIKLAPLLQQMWPNARFVFMQRRGIENVLSRRRSFPGQPFEQACADWAECMEEWLLVGPKLRGAAMVIDQTVLARNPDWIAPQLGEFLSLTNAETDAIVTALRGPGGEETWREPPAVASEDLDWDETQWQVFRQHCDTVMAQFGYSYGREYHTDTGQWIGSAIL